MEEEEDETNVEKEIKRWATVRGKAKGIRTLTATMAWETIVLQTPEFPIQCYVQKGAACLSRVITDGSLFANYGATSPRLRSIVAYVGGYRCEVPALCLQCNK